MEGSDKTGSEEKRTREERKSVTSPKRYVLATRPLIGVSARWVEPAAEGTS